MNAKCLREGAQARSVRAMWCWIVLAIAGLGCLALIEYLAGEGGAGGLLEQLFSYQLASYANLLLICAAMLYVGHLRFTAQAVGRAASGFAAAGALCLLLGISMRWMEIVYLRSAGPPPPSGLYEVMSLFSAITVVIYLVMERVYRTRSAGAFVMPIVVSAVLFEIWLLSNEQAASGQLPLFKSYWIHAHVLANFIGYGGFAVAASLGVMFLLRQRAQGQQRPEQGFALRSLPDLHSIDRLMHQAICLGFPAFSVATLLGIASAWQTWGWHWVWDPKEALALIVWLTYATYFHVRYTYRWQGQRVAWWALTGFGVTVFCFFGVNLLFSGFHSYGQFSL